MHSEDLTVSISSCGSTVYPSIDSLLYIIALTGHLILWLHWICTLWPSKFLEWAKYGLHVPIFGQMSTLLYWMTVMQYWLRHCRFVPMFFKSVSFAFGFHGNKIADTPSCVDQATVLSFRWLTLHQHSLLAGQRLENWTLRRRSWPWW
jgi:hypothetical protein